MRIVIAGAGEVGTHLAKLLSRENMEISLMDESAERLGDLDANYDLITRVGNPTSIHDLTDIGVKDADLFISVTPSETENMTSCLIANQLGAKKTLARIDNYEYLLPENRRFFEDMGLNHLIYPEVLAAHEIVESLHTNWLRYRISLCEGALQMSVVKIRENAPVIGQTFASGYYDHGCYRIVAIKRGQDTIIPKGTDEVQADDMVYAICTKENIEFMREQFGKPKREIKNVIFYGGTRITQKAAQQLPSDMNIKILEANKDLCYHLSEKVNNALIINVDGSDMESLKEEGIQDADAFVAVTDHSEANIFACLAAKRFGVKKTIAEVENIDYIAMAEGLDIGTVLNKKTIAASYIYQMLLNASVLNVRNLTTADAQIVEFMATEGSRVTRKKIRDVGLPDESTIGGIVRAGEGLLVNGDTEVLPGDQVVVLCKSHVIRKLEKYFK
ncbi:MAG: Trk system potassium transporter TrkA [Paludibacteraceae bacterium]|nr:Trk system potassium transporter TrkA [Candidatus Colicola coprequi]MCQ2333541.1 Trk system potassium transporter TrkA [Paludibacteraceae bacterium]